MTQGVETTNTMTRLHKEYKQQKQWPADTKSTNNKNNDQMTKE